jgi:Cu+-exporting ATPase
MKNDTLAVYIIAAIVIVAGMFFYYSRMQPHISDSTINIVVSRSGYQPAMIQVPAGKPVNLHIVRENNEACKTSIDFLQLNSAYPFMLDIPINVTLPPLEPGTVDFVCEGSNLHGRIVVV